LTWFIAPENDYRGVAELAAGDPPTVAVVVPVFNRVGLLRNTIAGLGAQSYPVDLVEVIVADDGSTEDVAGAIADLTEGIRLTVVRQEHEGYGAGRARNLGAGHAGAEVLVFIDADCIPDPELIARHASWHRRAANLVVIGSRQHLDSSRLDAADLAAGRVRLRERVVAGEAAGSAATPDDFRRLFYRRTANLRTGDEAFRSLVSSNFSVRRDRFFEVGGFSPDFTRWGGEDTELGWRLFTSGMVFLPENAAAIYHQIQDDAGPRGWRDEARRANDGIIQAKIPHRFYRKSERGFIYEAPKVSVVVHPTIPQRAAEIWDQMLRQSFTDFEVILAGGDPAVDGLGELLRADPRLTVLPAAVPEAQLDAAIHRSRGEYVAILHGWASADHRLLGRAVRRLDANPRSSIARCGYQVITGSGATSYLYDEAVADLDRAWNPSGLPCFAMVRRREWSKVRRAGADPAAMWKRLQALSGAKQLRDALVGLPGLGPDDEMPERFPPITGERTLLVDDLTKGGPRRAARAVGRYVLAKARHDPYRPVGLDTPTPAKPPAETTTATPGVTYIGWLGRNNFGDEAMLDAVRGLLPGADVGYEVDNRRALMLGGGTLINRLTYLEALQRNDSPRLERVVFGTGVADPDYWQITEPIPEWIDFLDSCLFVGVRGPRSATILREWGYDGEMEVIGDPALALQPPDVVRDPNLVVVSPAWTGGELWGGDDGRVFTALAAAVAAMRDEGRRVAFLSCHPGDDRHIMEMMREAGTIDAGYVAAYEDRSAALALLAEAGVVVAERLHAAVAAAACGTPAVAIEYRPKIRDFARSIDQEAFVIRSDQVDAAAVRQLVAEVAGTDLGGRLAATVAGYRSKLATAAGRLADAISN
jgi:glycosyltransferase involved in cell wall biosynthesis